IIGAILFAAFMAAVLQHLILAVNRLFVVSRSRSISI
uniref:ABC transporter permease n=1 Tax=Ditylenchus dipsaci TaxID=166011 RepID=A0A915ELA8_9BILA